MMSRYTTTPMLGAAACAVLAMGVALYGAPGKAQGPTTAAATEADRSTAQPPLSSDLDTNMWVLVRDSTNPEALQSYLQSFPSGKFAEQARQRLASLREQQGNGARVTPAPSGEPPQNIARTTPPPAPQVTPPTAENKELARALQRELKRLGCFDAEADGVWGDKSRAALKSFVRHAKLGITGDEPNISVLDAAAATRARVCPLVCSDDEKVVGDRCVGATKPQPARREQVRAPQREPRRAWAAEPSEPRGNSNSGKRICFGAGRNEIVTCP